MLCTLSEVLRGRRRAAMQVEPFGDPLDMHPCQHGVCGHQATPKTMVNKAFLAWFLLVDSPQGCQAHREDLLGCQYFAR